MKDKHARFLSGNIAAVSLFLGWDADLIRAGARGPSGFEHFLTGSAADTIVRHSPIPVITVR